MKKLIIIGAALLVAACATNSNEKKTCAEDKAEVTLDLSKAQYVIPDEIYGQFAEHLGSCIYGGIWVGPDSNIPNTNGYRNDVLNALKALRPPVVRGPGGCFADYYHWQDGIGPRKERPRMVNSSWGGTVEDNSFGTHEFLDFCELIGCEPYISGNVGSGSPSEMSNWVEYMTAENGKWADQRKKNGREKPWKVKYLGVGNESWGCGGAMTPEYYTNLYRQFGEYCRDLHGNHLYKVASGASDYDYNWTEVLMGGIGKRMSGISLHYYSVINWNSKGKALQFEPKDYLVTMGKAMGVEPVIKKHIEIMDKFDPEGKIDLLLDEWGTWWEVEEGTNPGHLFQQNTMRDALVAAASLNIFHQYTRRLKMTNIAQMVNVLQAMILTKGPDMLLTPTYHVFNMYNAHRGNKNIPVEVASYELAPAQGDWAEVPTISASASVAEDGSIVISLANLSPDKAVEVCLNGLGSAKIVEGTLLAAESLAAHNTFESPETVVPEAFKAYKDNVVTIPEHSIVTLKAK